MDRMLPVDRPKSTAGSADANPLAQERGRRLAAMVKSSSGWRRVAIAFGAGVLTTLAFAPFHFFPILLFTLPVLVWLLDGSATLTGRARLVDAARSGWLFGFGFHFVGLHWIGEAFLVEAEVFAWLLPFAVTLMPAGLALFHMVAAAVAVAVWRPGLGRVVVLALALSATEWLRGHIFTGFPWNILGYALTNDLVLMQSASVIGIYGLGLVAVLAFASPLVAWVDADGRPNPDRARWRGSLLLVALLVPMVLFGALRLWIAGQSAMVEGVKLRLVQPSVPQNQKWRPDLQRQFFQEHLDLSGRDPKGMEDGLSGITHVVWAEASMPFHPLRSPEALKMIAERIPAPIRLLAGALRAEDRVDANGHTRRHAFNSFMDFAPGANVASIYDKIHLVPFGEYLPFQATLEAIGLEQLTRVRGGFSIGTRPRPLMAIPGLPLVGPLICYEAIFPSAVVQGSTRPGVLVNATNDGWFGTLTGPYQHFHQSRVRAVEEGLPLIRVSNNGISAVVDPLGRVLDRLELNQRGSIDSGLPEAIGRPFYSVFGDLTFLLIWLAGVSAVVIRHRPAK